MITRVCLSCVVLLVLGACGGSSISFPVDGNKKLGDLTDEDAQAICHALEPMFSSLDHLMCTVKGVSKAASGQGSCETERVECLKNDSISDEMDCSKATANELADCDATINAYEACVNDTYNMIKSLQSSVYCGASPTELQALQSKFQLPASCQVLQQQCPSIDVGVG